MKIHLLYAKGNEELLNRQSALGSYINCLCSILEEVNITVCVNGVLFKDFSKLKVQSANVNPIGKGRFGFVPSFIKNALKDYRKLKQVGILKSKIIQSNFIPDLYLEFYNYGSDLGYTLSKKNRKPLVVIYDAPVMEEFEFFNGRNVFFRNSILKREKISLKHASRIVVYSSAVKKFLIQKFNIAENVFAIHQNVDFTRFEFQNPKTNFEIPVIGFIGSFLKWHRVDLLIDAFEFIRKKGISAKLVLAGSGAEWNNINQRCLQSDFKSDIEVKGFLDGRALTDVKARMNIGIMPGSNWYGAPNKIFEYGAAGLAVIAPDTPTIQSLFENKSEVVLFRWDDSVDLCNRLEEVLTNKILYANISKNLHHKIKASYSVENTRSFYSMLFKSLVK